MTDQLAQAINNLRQVLQSESDDHCVYVSVFFNSEGHQIEYGIRTPETLKREGISMRNIRGDFIKDKQ